MGFGRNPHVEKAEAAEQKAELARDTSAQEQAWREAGRQWERAAARETDKKRRALYEANAEKARTTADAPPPLEGAAIDVVASDADAGTPDPDAN